jgi:lysozyme family protein
VQGLDVNEARLIYQKEFILSPGFAAITDPDVRAMVVDAGVNHGPDWAIRATQKVLGLGQDGVFGPQTVSAINQTPKRMFMAGFIAERAEKYGRIISADHTQASYAAGWLARLSEFIRGLA